MSDDSRKRVGLAAILFLRGFDFGLMVPTIHFKYFSMLKDENMATYYMGINAGAFTCSTFLSSLIVGLIYDRTRQFKVLFSFLTFCAISGYIIFAFANTPTVAIVGQIISGFFPSASVLVYAEMSRDVSKVTKALSFSQIFDPLAAAIGSSLNLWVLSNLNSHTERVNINAATAPPLICASACTIVFIVVHIALRDVTFQDTSGERKPKFNWSHVSYFLNNYFLLLMFILQILVTGTFFSFNIFTQSILSECFSCPTKCGSLVFLASSLAKIVILLVIPLITSYMNELVFTIITLLVQVILMTGVAFTTIITGKYVCYLVVCTGVYSYTLIWIASYVLITSVIGSHLPIHLKATGQGINYFCSSVSGVIAQPLAGMFFYSIEWYSILLAFFILVLITLINTHLYRNSFCLLKK